jgi:hypothetical protein
VSRRLATITFLAVLLVGCTTKAPFRYTDPVSAPTSSVDRGAGREPDRTYETDPIEESGNTVQGPPDSAAPVPPKSSWRPQFEIDFALGLPQGEFADQVDDLGLGASILGGIGLPSWPVVLGAEFCFLTYGREKRTEPFSTTIPDVYVDVITTNDIVMGHLLVRVQPRSGWLRPYLDALFGFKYFSTSTSIPAYVYDPGGSSGFATLASTTQLDDTALSYGAGAGLDIRLKEWSYSQGGVMALRLNLGARYLFGSEARYLKEGSIRRQEDEVEFDILRSRTDMLIIQIGLALEF